MGTPHQGSADVSWGMLARNVVSLFTKTKKETPELELFPGNSEWLAYQQELFQPISNRFETVYFYETYPTPFPGGGSVLVCIS